MKDCIGGDKYSYLLPVPLDDNLLRVVERFGTLERYGEPPKQFLKLIGDRLRFNAILGERQCIVTFMEKVTQKEFERLLLEAIKAAL